MRAAHRFRVLAAALLLAVLVSPLPTARAATGGGAVVSASPASAAPGTQVTVSGAGWPASALITVLLCGRNMVDGTEDCANANGHAVTSDSRGGFATSLAVVLPPKPCPCVIHTTTVTGPKITKDLPYTVTGAEVVPLPAGPVGAGHLVLLSAELTGDSGVMNWFGAPAGRTLRVTVANMGVGTVTDPVFRLGLDHSVFATDWTDYRWNGVLASGSKQDIDVPVDFPSGASGRYQVQLRYQESSLAARQVDLPRPWGVVAFWVLLYVVVAVGLFRIGLAVVNRYRPRPAAAAVAGAGAGFGVEFRGRRIRRVRTPPPPLPPPPLAPGWAPWPPAPQRPAAPRPATSLPAAPRPPGPPAAPPPAAPPSAARTLPWFGPGTGPPALEPPVPPVPPAPPAPLAPEPPPAPPAPAPPLDGTTVPTQTTQVRTPGPPTLLSKGIDA